MEYLLDNGIHPKSEVVLSDNDLLNCLREWMTYKDEKKPKSTHHLTEMGLKKAITQFVSAYRDYGIDALRTVVDECMACGYQGVIWDKLSRLPKQQKTETINNTEVSPSGRKWQ